MRSLGHPVAIAALGILVACGTPAASSVPASVRPSPSASESAAAEESPAAQLPAGRTVGAEATIPIAGAYELVSGENRVWMLTGDSITGIDPTANEVAEVIPLPFGYGGMVEAARILWFPDFDAGVLHRYDLDSGEWLGDVAVMEHPNRISVHAGSVWVANGHGRWVNRVDPVAGAVTATWSPLEDDATAETAPPNAFWGTSADAREAFAIDVASDTLASEIEVPFSPCAAYPLGEGATVAPCIENGQTPQITVVGPSPAASVTFELPGWPVAMLPIEDRLWLPLLRTEDVDGVAGSPVMIALDPSTGDIADVIAFDPPAYSIATGFGALWVATADAVLRVPLTELRQE